MRPVAALLALLMASSCWSSQSDPGSVDLGFLPIGGGPEIVDKLPPGATPVFLDCEWGCPPGPFYIRIVEVTEDATPEIVTTEDATPEIVAVADSRSMDVEIDHEDRINCVDDWDFSACCGDGTCQPEETAFFCPSDCI